MATIKQLEAFKQKVIGAIIALGAVPCDKSYHQPRYEIQTKAGRLQITLHTPDAPSKVYSIYSRFDNEKIAKAMLPEKYTENLNQFSGKWNFGSYNQDYCLETFIDALTSIL